MAQHRAQRLTARAAAAELGLGRARFYKLYSDYLHACAHGQADTWSPGRSGGDHHPDWSASVTALLTKQDVLGTLTLAILAGHHRLQGRSPKRRVVVLPRLRERADAKLVGSTDLYLQRADVENGSQERGSGLQLVEFVCQPCRAEAAA